MPRRDCLNKWENAEDALHRTITEYLWRAKRAGVCWPLPEGMGEAALEALGELNGKRVRDDLVETIFSRFCVGK